MTVAIVVQDALGTVANANAYDTVAAFKAYHALRGNSIAGYTDDQIAVALIRATDYIDVRFTFPGTILVPAQPDAAPPVVAQTTAWPRTAASTFDDTFTAYGGPFGPTTYSTGLAGPVVPAGIPIALKKACHEYAFKALTTHLFVDVVPDASGRLIEETTEKVDVIESHVKYAAGQAMNGDFVMPAYPQADLLLARAGLIFTAARTVVR